ncbi:uncharacterized protein DNG_09551 [Cephalotrichum gorgonifer]|uniref:Uncharacterized protein n=1 Tax=Cephalotrichum gorgonifer TaxID=2041049 RepID=A0AAE8T090_9PEZI|nr:uncharacterized protein DNG_09551 [Cephalotrichum gorgonifer]
MPSPKPLNASDSGMLKHVHAHHIDAHSSPDCKIDEAPPPYESAVEPSADTPTGDHVKSRSHPPTMATDEELIPFLRPAKFPWESGCGRSVGQSPPRVATLPCGSVVEKNYLHHVRHSDNLVQGAKIRRPWSLAIFRAIRSGFHTESHYESPVATADGTCKPRGTVPPSRLGPGEEEHYVGITYDWTRDWDFVLSVKNESREMRGKSEDGDWWVGYAHIYFNDLSGLDCEAVPWNDTARTQRLAADGGPQNVYRFMAKDALGCGKKDRDGWLRYTWKFRERSDYPRWGGSFTVYYRDQGLGVMTTIGDSGLVPGIERPWDFFNPESCRRAEMDRRTGCGLFKKLVWYDDSLGYGNDLLDEPVEPMTPGSKVRYASFVSSLLPRMPEKDE